MSKEPISNNDDVIDSRDVLERIEELEGVIESGQEIINDFPETEDQKEHLATLQDNLNLFKEELANLKALETEAEGYAPDWQYGAQLVRDSYFTQHIEEIIDECYEMPKGFNSGEWPWRHMKIDFEAAAEEAKQDYTSVEFSGVTYWVR